MNLSWPWKGAVTALVAGATLALSACIIAPSKFVSTFEVRNDGTFSFSYDGQIHLMALSRLAEMSAAADANEEFSATVCYDDEGFEERACTEAEIADQRQEWERQAGTRKQDAKREAEQMKQLLGGIDPSDPAAAEELASRLRRQEGWKRVEYRGDGLFEVEFAIASRMGHDFVFPTLERFPMSNSFVVANLRQGSIVRIEAPGFAPMSGGNPLQSMMTGMAASLAMGGAAEGSDEAHRCRKWKASSGLSPMAGSWPTTPTRAPQRLLWVKSSSGRSLHVRNPRRWP